MVEKPQIMRTYWRIIANICKNQCDCRQKLIMKAFRQTISTEFTDGKKQKSLNKVEKYAFGDSDRKNKQKDFHMFAKL